MVFGSNRSAWIMIQVWQTPNQKASVQIPPSPSLRFLGFLFWFWLVSYFKQSLLWSVVIEVSLVLYCLFMKCIYNTQCVERAGGRYCLLEYISWFLGFYHTFNIISFPSFLQRAFRYSHIDSCSSLLLQPVVWDGSTVGHQLGIGKQLAEPEVKAI